MIPWHRLIGTTLKETYETLERQFELEKDLSLKKQLLDILIVYNKNPGPDESLPDGLDLLHQYNLITYKSMQESMSRWAINELMGHYTNLRKQIATDPSKLPLEEDFAFYAVATRYPQKLLSQVEHAERSQGVFDVVWGAYAIRLIVLSIIPPEPHNVIWNLFSGDPDMVEYGLKNYWKEGEPLPQIFDELLSHYHLEGLKMPYTTEEFIRDVNRRVISEATLQDRLEGLPKEEVLKNFSLEDRLEGLSLKEIEAYLQKLKSQN